MDPYLDQLLGDVVEGTGLLNKEERVYIDDPSEAPEDANLQEGPQGGTYYVEGGGSDSEPAHDDSGESDDGGEAEGEPEDDSPDFQPNPEEDVQRFMESDATTEMIETTNSEPMEGFTVQRNLQTEDYDYWGEDAWTVGLTSIEVSADDGLSKEDVAEFYEQWTEVLEDEPGLRIGGYHFEDGSKISVDLSAMVEDQEEAEQLGEQLNQESIFNPKTAMETDFAEGSVNTYEGEDVGESPVESAEDVKEVLSDIDSLKKRLRKMAEKSTDGVFVSDEGEEITRKQIGNAMRHEPGKVEKTENGYIVGETEYRPKESGDDESLSLGERVAEELTEDF